MNPFIFRKEDIRGIVDQDWSAHDAGLIARAFGTWLRKKKESQVILAYDNRLSTPKIYEEVREGLLSTGVNVVDLGLGITPLVYFARQHLKIKGALMITASHNPPEWNGMKICYHGATTIYGDDIQEIRRLTEGGKFTQGSGKLEKKDLTKVYLGVLEKHLELEDGVRKSQKSKTLKVVVDAGNAPAGIYAVPLLESLGCQVVQLHTRLDSTYPNHLPDPVEGKNILELYTRVKEEKADLGIAFDGDGDRINVLDEKGYGLWGDGLVILFARDILKRHPGARILFNSQCSPAVEEDIAAHGGIPSAVPTGHAAVADLLEKQGGLFAGEYKGHMFFADHYYGFDDAVYAAGRVVRILQSTQKPLSKIMAGAPSYKSTGEIVIPCPDEKKFFVEKKVGEALRKNYYVEDLAGDVRVKFRDGLKDAWGLVRNSDTTPAMQVYAWAKNDRDLERVRDIMVKEVQRHL